MPVKELWKASVDSFYMIEGSTRDQKAQILDAMIFLASDNSNQQRSLGADDWGLLHPGSSGGKLSACSVLAAMLTGCDDPLLIEKCLRAVQVSCRNGIRAVAGDMINEMALNAAGCCEGEICLQYHILLLLM